MQQTNTDSVRTPSVTVYDRSLYLRVFFYAKVNYFPYKTHPLSTSQRKKSCKSSPRVSPLLHQSAQLTGADWRSLMIIMLYLPNHLLQLHLFCCIPARLALLLKHVLSGGSSAAAAAQSRAATLLPHPVQQAEPQHQKEPWRQRAQQMFSHPGSAMKSHVLKYSQPLSWRSNWGQVNPVSTDHLETFLRLQWSPPASNSGDWTWSGKAHTLLM